MNQPAVTSLGPPRPIAASGTLATHLVLPGDTNMRGTLFGGKIMQWMDIAASVSASRHAAHAVVTAAVDDLTFQRPIRLGDVVIIKACVNYAGKTSMEVGVRVEVEDIHTRLSEHCLSGYFTFVAVDVGGNPVSVPPIVAESEREKYRYRAAKARVERRRAQRFEDASEAIKKL